MPRKPLLSIILPVCNEEKRLPLALIEIDQYLSQQKYSWEVVVVNNNSVDNTKEITKRFIPLIKNLKLTDHSARQSAKGEWHIFLDSIEAVGYLSKIIPCLKGNYKFIAGVQRRWWRPRYNVQCIAADLREKIGSVDDLPSTVKKMGYKIKEISVC